MTNTNMRKGFTMIELIFVIVIIGILATVAIPKLAANKDDATAATCNHEIGQLLGEMSQAYAASPDFATWQQYTLEDNITNIRTGAGAGNGIIEAGTTKPGAPTAVNYRCDGEQIIVVTPSQVGTNYRLTAGVTDPTTLTSPAAIKAATKLQSQYGGLTKVFNM